MFAHFPVGYFSFGVRGRSPACNRIGRRVTAPSISFPAPFVVREASIAERFLPIANLFAIERTTHEADASGRQSLPEK